MSIFVGPQIWPSATFDLPTIPVIYVKLQIRCWFFSSWVGILPLALGPLGRPPNVGQPIPSISWEIGPLSLLHPEGAYRRDQGGFLPPGKVNAPGRCRVVK